MPINFPSSPTLNQTYTVGTKTWVWNGYAWVIQSIVNNIGATDNLARAAYGEANGAVQTGFTTISANTISIIPSSNADTLTIFAGNNITIDANSTTKTITIASTASGGGGDGPLAQAAYDAANAGIALATSAYGAANTAASNTVYLQTVNDLQNTNITSVNTFAQAAYNQANTGGAPTTIGIQTNASYFPIFVDANNATATAETLTTHGSLSYNPSTRVLTAGNFADGTGSYNVNLGSGGTEGRGVVAGYSGGAYGGIGYNIRHTTTSNVYTAPLSDTVSYLRFDTGGFTFKTSPVGSAGRNIADGQTIATLTAAGVLTANSFSGAGTGLTGTASSLSIGGSAASLTSATWQRITGNAVDYGSYGSIGVSGTTNTYAGISFSGVSGTLMMSSGASGFYYSNSTWRVYWDGSGNQINTGYVRSGASDKRLKKNIEAIKDAYYILDKIEGVYFDWDQEVCNKFHFFPPEKDAGLLAQDVKEVYPYAVHQAPFDKDPLTKTGSKSGKEYLTIQYEKLVPVLVQANKQLREECISLEKRVADLENIVSQILEQKK